MNKGILGKIAASKKRYLSKEKSKVPLETLKEQVQNNPVILRDFGKALTQGEPVSLIAEIKKASPSAGIIRDNFDAPAIAKEYESGADAISVLTEKDFFQGSLETLLQVRGVVSLPVLAKDFFLDEYQLYQARNSGADAVLLIAGILEQENLAELIAGACNLGMDQLVEVHNETELGIALDAGAEIIGINNRDLKTFKVDLGLTEKLARSVPDDKIIVSESGIDNRADVEFLIGAGVDAILVGEFLMRSENIREKISELLGGGR